MGRLLDYRIREGKEMTVFIEKADQLNEFELIKVVDHLHERGIENYTVRPGNGCVWVSYQSVDCYYIFQDGHISDVQFD